MPDYQETQGIIFLVILLVVDPECQIFLPKYLSISYVFFLGGGNKLTLTNTEIDI